MVDRPQSALRDVFLRQICTLLLPSGIEEMQTRFGGVEHGCYGHKLTVAIGRFLASRLVAVELECRVQGGMEPYA
ncbi:hypothetical protein D3C71_1873230 [compost metagenome]